MKYIIAVEIGTNYETAVVFPDFTTHTAVNNPKLKAVSAGFFLLHQDKTTTVYGESVSLGLKPRPEDTKILEKLFNDQH